MTRNRVIRRLSIIILLTVLCLRISGAENRSTFSLAILSDTQNYSRDDPAMFNAQTQWIVDHSLQNNIAFTTHLGDIVDRVNQSYEWENATHAISILKSGNAPYSLLAGNHDILNMLENDEERDRQNEPFLNYFPVDDTQQYSVNGGYSPSKFNSYHIFEFEGQQFLVFALDWKLSDNSIAWVQTILDRYPYTPTIVSTHDLVNVDSDGNIYLTHNGKLLWEQLIASNNQIFLTINGHHFNVGHTVLQNHQGNDVLMMLVNYQTDYQGGNGMMRLLTLDLAQNVIYAESFSPYVMSIPPEERDIRDIERKTDPANQFAVKINIFNRFDSILELVKSD